MSNNSMKKLSIHFDHLRSGKKNIIHVISQLKYTLSMVEPN